MIGSKVLIVDDDPELVALVSTWLRNDGFQTCSAPDAVSCMMQARKERPDLIVLDLGLPGGDGLIALERLKRNTHTSSTPVVVLSAKSAEEASSNAMAAGARAYLEKSGERAGFMAVIRDVLDREATAESFV